jgi:hypothetical protein
LSGHLHQFLVGGVLDNEQDIKNPRQQQQQPSPQQQPPHITIAVARTTRATTKTREQPLPLLTAYTNDSIENNKQQQQLKTRRTDLHGQRVVLASCPFSFPYAAGCSDLGQVTASVSWHSPVWNCEREWIGVMMGWKTVVKNERTEWIDVRMS